MEVKNIFTFKYVTVGSMQWRKPQGCEPMPRLLRHPLAAVKGGDKKFYYVWHIYGNNADIQTNSKK